MTRMFLAAYDPAHFFSGGQCWPWSHEAISEDLRDSFYEAALARDLPRDPESITPADCLGGYAQTNAEWGCWYRAFNGGRDQFNRGRYVIGCAFIPLDQGAGRDCSGILYSGAFEELSRTARELPPLPAPSSLELDLNCPVLFERPKLLHNLLNGQMVLVSGENALALAGRLAAFAPAGMPCHCRLRRSHGNTAFSFAQIQPASPEAPCLAGSLAGPAPCPPSLTRSAILRLRKWLRRPPQW